MSALLKVFISAIFSLTVVSPVSASVSSCIQFYTPPTQEHVLIQKQFELYSSRTSSTLARLPENARMSLFGSLRDHVVAGVHRLGIYDPKGLIGFCFGRSFTAYLLARQMGLQVTAIRNLFIIGDLRSGRDPEWRFHVTSVMQLSNGEWYAFDPVIPQNRPVPVAEWVKTVKQIWDKKNQAKLYVTSPFDILPDIRNMAAPGLEKGTDIIDLSFNPKAMSDIVPGHSFGKSLSNVPYFEISENSRPYFLRVNPEKRDSFTFDQLAVNGMEISFNNFFRDLFDSFLKPGFQTIPAWQALSINYYIPPVIDPSKFGMVFDNSFWQLVQGERP